MIAHLQTRVRALLQKFRASCTPFVALQLSFFALGCANDVDETPNVLPSSIVAGDGGVRTDDGEILVGHWYAYQSLVLDTLDGKDHPAVNVLNALWASDLAQQEMNVLYMVTEVDDQHIWFRGFNGVRTDDGYCLVKETELPVHMNRSGQVLTMEEPTRFTVYTGSVDIPKNCAPNLTPRHMIPVDQAWFKIEISSDNNTLTGVVESATIPERAIDGVCTCVTAPGTLAEKCGGLDSTYENEKCAGCGPNYHHLRGLMEIFGKLNLSCKDDDGAPGVCMTAHFEAARLAESPIFCADGSVRALSE